MNVFSEVSARALAALIFLAASDEKVDGFDLVALKSK
jgi:hypothetical protein